MSTFDIPVRSSRAVLVALALSALSIGALAQANWREVAVPVYPLDAYAHGEALDQAARAGSFAASSRELTAALVSYCAGPSDAAALRSVQATWAAAARSWDALAALSTGPLIERRSARSIDFMPARPQLLAKAVAAAPQTAADMERIGAPARGFPALELLLWPERTLQARSPECAYAHRVAADIASEAQALDAAAAQRVDTRVENEAALAQLVETVNQWVGGVEQLRWAFMRKPMEMAETRGTAPLFPRQLSGQTAATWAARWQTLRDTAVLGARSVPKVDEAPVPFETLLRGRGLNPLADRLVALTTRADRAMQGLQPESPQKVSAAAQTLGELTAMVQEHLAPALDVRMGFSDADGD